MVGFNGEREQERERAREREQERACGRNEMDVGQHLDTGTRRHTDRDR